MAPTLLAMSRSRWAAPSTARQVVGTVAVGTKATNGAQTPAKFSRVFSATVLPRTANSATPMVTSEPIRKPCTGV